MKLYRTIRKRADIEYIVEKSKFIAHIVPVSSKEEADAFIAAIKKEYWDATHNVPALILGEKSQTKWASDDGEPQGTSGVPMLKFLEGEGLTNVLIVVTRYFGGIKLGTGGLSRAYVQAAKMALEEAGVCDVKEVVCFTYRCDYTYLTKIQNMGLYIDQIAYDEMVSIKILTEPEELDHVLATLSNITSGRGTVVESENVIKKY